MKHWLSTLGFVSGAILLAGLLAASTAGAAVVLSFTGTVTGVQSINATPPEISVGNPVSGTVVYGTGGATTVEVGPSERAYVFPPASGHEITVTIGTLVWKADLQGVSVCNEECGGDYLDYTGFSTTTVDFPDNLGSGLVALEYSDAEPPYGLLDGHDLPNGPEDIHFAEAVTKMGTLSSSNGGSSFWVIAFDVESETVPVRNVTWSEVKALFSRP